MSAGVSLSRLGLGGAQLGNLYRAMPEATAAEMVDTAWEHGIRYFDTAPHYGLGLSESRLGALLRGRPRDSYLVSTKVGRLLVPNPDFAGEPDTGGFAVPASTIRQWDFSRDGVRSSIRDSLRRLRLDRVDIAFLHDPEDHWDQALREALPALIELREEGVVTAIGAGMNHARHLTELVRHHDVDLVMCAGRHTLLEQADELMSAAHGNGVGVVIAGVYNSGLLAAARPQTEARYNYEVAEPQVIARVQAIADICERHGVALPEAALAFPFRHPAVVSIVVGADSPAHLSETVGRFSRPVPHALWAELAEAGLISAEAG